MTEKQINQMQAKHEKTLNGVTNTFNKRIAGTMAQVKNINEMTAKALNVLAGDSIGKREVKSLTSLLNKIAQTSAKILG